MTWIDELIGNYKTAVVEIEQIDDKKCDAESNLKLQMIRGSQTYDEKIRAMRAEKKLYEEEMEDYIASIMLDYESQKAPFLESFREMEHCIGILNGSALREVYRFEDREIHAHNCRVKFFDEFYDNECMSLRAIIVEDDNGFGLYIVGSTENGVYKFGEYSLMLHAEKWSKPLPVTVICEIEFCKDFDKLKEFYENEVKEFKCKNEAMKYVDDMATTENKIHKENEWIKGHMHLEDFEPILGAICYKCGNDAMTKMSMKEKRIKVPVCRHCGADMGLVNDV